MAGSASRRQPRLGPVREPEHRAVVGHEHPVGVASGRDPLDVGDDRLGHVHHPPPRTPGPPAQVGVLGVHEVRLVEPAQLLQGTTAGEEARSRHPVHLGDPVRGEVPHPVPAREAVVRHQVAEQRMADGVDEGREPARRGVAGAVGLEDPGPGDGEDWVGLEHRRERGQRALVHGDVGVGHQDELEPAHGDAPVGGRPVPEVRPGLHEADPAVGGHERLGGPVAGRVVDHRHLRDPFGSQRRHALEQGGAGLVVHHHRTHAPRHLRCGRGRCRDLGSGHGAVRSGGRTGTGRAR